MPSGDVLQLLTLPATTHFPYFLVRGSGEGGVAICSVGSTLARDSLFHPSPAPTRSSPNGQVASTLHSLCAPKKLHSLCAPKKPKTPNQKKHVHQGIRDGGANLLNSVSSVVRGLM